MFTLGILHSTIRLEEKLLVKAAGKKGIKVQLIDIRKEVFNSRTYHPNFDIALERSVSTIKGSYAVEFLESIGVSVINSSRVSRICEDKFLTSLDLVKHHVPTPQFAMVFGVEEAKKAIEEMGGFPVVIKPNLGSWGRLLAKVNDIDALEAILEHKDVLGSPDQKAIYLQQFVEKNGKDIRAFVIDGETICAIYRTSPHWITNTAKGGVASNCKVTKTIQKICRAASDAVGGGILAMDLFENKDGLSVNEINHTMEFKNSEEPTGVSISSKMIDYCIEVYSRHSGEARSADTRIPSEQKRF